MRILSLPGGGVRGILQARLLERIEQERPFLAQVDAFAGASVGALNAVWLALGRPVQDLVPLYRKAAPFVFGSGFLARHAGAALRATLATHLGDKRLQDLPRPVLAYSVSAVGIELARPDELLVDVALAATAAPGALPAHQGKVDGGLVQNDPSAAALAWAEKRGTPRTAVRIFSVGTGVAPPAPSAGGLFGALKAAMAVGQCAAQVECHQALGDRYYRLQPRLDREVALDDATAVNELVETADRADIGGVSHWLRAAFGT